MDNINTHEVGMLILATTRMESKSLIEREKKKFDYSKFRSYVIQFCSLNSLCLGYTMYGWVISFTSPIEAEVLGIGLFDTFTLSLFSSLSLFGFSSFITSLFAKEWSCKFILMVCTLFGATGWMLIIISYDVPSMLVGRVLTGVHVGSCMGLSMGYMGEICNKNQLKFYGALILFPSSVALVVLYILADYFTYRWLAVFGMGGIVLQAILLLFSPQSPTWLVYMGLNREAKDTMVRIHGEEFDTEEEVKSIMLKLTLSSQKTTYSNVSGFFKWRTLRPIIIVCTLQGFKGCSGQPVYYSYAASLFSNTAFNPNISSLPYPILLSAGCLVSVLLANRVSKKNILLSTTFMQAIANFSFFIYYILSSYTTDCAGDSATTAACVLFSLWPILNLSLYSFFYSIGWGTISWTLYANIFEPDYKEVSAGLVTLFYALVLTSIVFVFPNFTGWLGDWPFFLLLTVECVAGLVFEYFVF